MVDVMGLASGGARAYTLVMLSVIAVCLAAGLAVGGASATDGETSLEDGRETLASVNANVTADMAEMPPGYRQAVGSQIDVAMAAMRAGFEAGYRYPGIAGPIANALVAAALLGNGWYLYRRIGGDGR